MLQVLEIGAPTAICIACLLLLPAKFAKFNCADSHLRRYGDRREHNYLSSYQIALTITLFYICSHFICNKNEKQHQLFTISIAHSPVSQCVVVFTSFEENITCVHLSTSAVFRVHLEERQVRFQHSCL